MKWTNTLLGCLAGMTLTAQSYDFNATTQTYSSLTNPIDITTELWDDQTFEITPGFEFELFNQNVNTFELSVNGHLSFIDQNEVEYAFGLFSIDLVDGGFSTPNYESVAVQMEVSGNAGDQVLKIEWTDAAVWGTTESVLDYQIWIYEATGNVEVHFGDNNLDSIPLGVGIIQNGGGIAYQDGFTLTGSPDSPEMTTFVGQKISAAPSSGVVYQFERTALASIPTISDTDLKAFVNNQYIHYQATEAFNYQIYDIEGKLISQGWTNHGGSISIAQFARMYVIVRFESKDGRQKVFRFFSAN